MELYESKEIMQLLNVSKPTFYSYIKTNKIKAFRIGRRWYVTSEELKRILRGGTNEQYLQN